MFTLCRTCAEINHQNDYCTHNEEARALTGVWVTVELNKALELGYRVGKITEVWHFEQRSSSIFVGYIHTFLKGKQEATGYPPDAADDEVGKKKYIDEYERHQGIWLDPEKINVNPAKRQVSKLCLNSFWGKFVQRTNLVQTQLVRTPEQFFNFAFSGQYDLRHVSFLPLRNEGDVALIQWSYNERSIVPPGRSNNIFRAAFTTAYACLKLCGYLERFQHRILYTDTDSLIYVVRDGETPLELGNYLGDLTDELGG